MSDPDDPPTPGLPVPIEPESTPAPWRERHDGWTAARRGRFFRALAETGCVRDACRVAGISSTSAYRMRRRDRDFAGEWFAALESAQPALEAAAYRRAVEGVDEPIVAGGKVIATRKRYSDSLLRMLIERGDLRQRLKGHPHLLTAEETRAGWGFDREGNKIMKRSPGEAFEVLKRRLAEIRERKKALAPESEQPKGDAPGSAR